MFWKLLPIFVLAKSLFRLTFVAGFASITHLIAVV